MFLCLEVARAETQSPTISRTASEADAEAAPVGAAVTTSDQPVGSAATAAATALPVGQAESQLPVGPPIAMTPPEPEKQERLPLGSPPDSEEQEEQERLPMQVDAGTAATADPQSGDAAAGSPSAASAAPEVAPQYPASVLMPKGDSVQLEIFLNSRLADPWHVRQPTGKFGSRYDMASQRKSSTDPVHNARVQRDRWSTTRATAIFTS